MNKVNHTIRILAIESSCDETAAAVIHVTCNMKHVTNLEIESNIISSQVKLHAKYGGVYPELASREHVRNIIPVIQEAIQKASNNSESSIQKLVSSMNSKSKIPNTNFQIQASDFDAIAVTTGPGLIGSLLVGVNTAKTLAYTLKKPIYAINHLEGHIYSCFTGEQALSRKVISRKKNLELTASERCERLRLMAPNFPLVSLVVSGGHTSLVYMKNHFDYKVIGETLDDAAGEAFDKVAKLLGLGYPGGPAIAKMAMTNSKFETLKSKQIQNSNTQNQNPKKLQATSYKLIKFPRPMINENNFDFSFSGLKTSVLYSVKKLKATHSTSSGQVSYKLKAEICHEFQEAVVETLVTKTLRAAVKYGTKSIILCGGVSANSRLRQEFELKIKNLKLKIDFFVPQKNLSTDNAAMIGIAAAYRIAIGKKPTPWYDVNADSNQKLF